MRLLEDILGSNSPRAIKFRFLIVGGLNTFVGLTLFPFLVWMTSGLNIHYLIIFIISYVLATTFSFLTNKFFVFKTSGGYLNEYVRFISFQLMHFILNIIVLPILVEIFRFKPIIIQPLFTLFVVITSYFWYSKIAFARQ